MQENVVVFTSKSTEPIPDISRKVQVGNDQEKAKSERNSHSIKRGRKTKLPLRYLY